ncbi:MAG TPA: hypothetical protein VK562_04025 [Candidatus Acidoferrum sp.]|nr:hypothetical protein [Candidatus Acidoferrum sp.]
MSSGKTDLKPVVVLARCVSWIGHPLVFISLSVAIIIILRLANRAGLALLLTLLVTLILPMGLLLLWGARTGRWSDADVSIRSERVRFYPRAIPISAMAVIALWLLGAPAMALRGAVVTLFLLLVAALVNFRIKLSLHALFAFYSALILFVVHPVVGAIAFALAFLVFWSRLYLGRHDLLETLVGASLGLLGGVVTAL